MWPGLMKALHEPKHQPRRIEQSSWGQGVTSRRKFRRQLPPASGENFVCQRTAVLASQKPHGRTYDAWRPDRQDASASPSCDVSGHLLKSQQRGDR